MMRRSNNAISCIAAAVADGEISMRVAKQQLGNAVALPRALPIRVDNVAVEDTRDELDLSEVPSFDEHFEDDDVVEMEQGNNDSSNNTSLSKLNQIHMLL
jgi:hypothetical protein